MTSNDKTGDQLVASMRRTKAGVKKKTAVTKKKVSSTSAERPSRRIALRAGELPAAQTEASTDPYQAGRRVWPD
ncbi:MAG: hypothetical protein PVG22_17385 [Chromatiales bacterium]|jgi:hypothetical protein